MFVVSQQIQHFLLQELLGCNVKLVKQRFQTFYSIGLLLLKLVPIWHCHKQKQRARSSILYGPDHVQVF